MPLLCSPGRLLSLLAAVVVDVLLVLLQVGISHGPACKHAAEALRYVWCSSRRKWNRFHTVERVAQQQEDVEEALVVRLRGRRARLLHRSAQRVELLAAKPAKQIAFRQGRSVLRQAL